MNKGYEYIDQYGSFRMENPQEYSYLYFPIANEAGMKSALTPLLGGDAKTGQNTFVLQPVSAENLHNDKATRNFWCRIDGKHTVSLTGASAQQEWQQFYQKGQPSAASKARPTSTLEAGLMWHKLAYELVQEGLAAEILSFAPMGKDAAELMIVTLHNHREEAVEVQTAAAIPIYGRSADNYRDHRHVTSLLHRIRTIREGVVVYPTLTFDERGHQKNETVYYVLGAQADGTRPTGFYPTVEEFLGEGGSFYAPGAIAGEWQTPKAAGTQINGHEAMGGLVFAPCTIEAGQCVSWIVMLGTAHVPQEEQVLETVGQIFSSYDTLPKALQSFEQTKQEWRLRMKVSYDTGDSNRDQFLYWVSFQPMLRRIYGCSFLPHHDYGKGGRGWRDLWQDCLALLLMNPQGVRQMLVNHFGGVRIDGSNATIIGSAPGAFIADRNQITRVWMDHGLWPLLTTDFYLNQTGDLGILLEEVPYFKDAQAVRGTARDVAWEDSQGNRQLDEDGNMTCGTVLEHLLIQQVTAFYEVGEHNLMRLRGADWNDALDMAKERGESVAFTAAYAGNFKTLAKLAKVLQEKENVTHVSLLPELICLLEADEDRYDEISYKIQLLDTYCRQCMHTVSAERTVYPLDQLAQRLQRMADWLTQQIRTTQWIQDGDKGWYNSYYDDHAQAVEGIFPTGVRMMLTGQVFTIMSGIATKEQTAQIVKAADTYLYEEAVGGYRLNTDFGEIKLDLGRMFGFAYGHKENGAVFSHMVTMYANALYQQGYAKEGYRALESLYRQASDFEKSKIYPGLPEYFNDKGRGMYHYLTGAASWYMMTVLTRMYGIRGEYGDLCLAPQLLAEQFEQAKGRIAVRMEFAGVTFRICYENPKCLDYGSYTLTQVTVDEEVLPAAPGRSILLKRDWIQKLSKQKIHEISVLLG